MRFISAGIACAAIVASFAVSCEAPSSDPELAGAAELPVESVTAALETSATHGEEVTFPLPPDRSLDGTSNNARDPRWGAVGERFKRITRSAYADGVAAPSGPERPNARAVSNRVCRAETLPSDPRGLSDMLGAWALLLSHDLQSFRAAEPTEQFGILVPADDDVMVPGATIPLARWIWDISTGRERSNPRLQINNSTSYLDASVIYGIDPTRAAALRTFSQGQMRVSDGNLLPFNTAGLPNRVPGPNFFLAGDERANTNFALIALQTLFVREHNRIAAGLAAATPPLTDEQIYRRARKIVSAEIQSITYQEFLPALLGPRAPSASGRYDPRTNATISEIFSVVGFRFGHSLLSPDYLLVDDAGGVTRVPQRETFFNPAIVSARGVEPIFRGLWSQVMQRIDPEVVDDIRNQTVRFGEKIDLVAYDIQSGREFGIADYSRVRADLGLQKIRSFREITADLDRRAALEDAYGDVSRIDALVGALSEDPLPNASVGPLFAAILREQFVRLRDGDRFWYENDPAFTPAEVAAIRATTLASVILRNTRLSDVPANVFYAH
ncbi:peroxidase family protein [Sorangium sp. So ce726]|uniref:peroxidase family protein n=1 Tax=Sorangium sp. So ce726 TaxID=3133319 RepID=UPI003F62CD48